MEVSGQLHASVALPLGKEPVVPIGWEAGGPQSQSGCYGGEKNLTVPGIQPVPSSS
jgi:hypothetical protein